MSFTGDEYGKRTLDFVQRIQGLTSYEEICREITTELKWFGFVRDRLVAAGSRRQPGGRGHMAQ